MGVPAPRGPRSGPAVRSPFRRAAISFIETYQTEVSHRIGASCRFSTSCSHYGLEAYRRHSFPVATGMTIARIARCHDPIRVRVLARALAAVGILAVAVIGVPMLAAASAAQVTGPCTATLAGVDATSASTPDRAIEVQYDQSVVATGTMSSGPVDYRVQLEFAGVRWTAASGTASGETWSDEVDIAQYATYGVGIYKVHATSTNATGERCTVDGYVKVVGKSPLTTAAGVLGAASLVGGLALTAGATLRAAKPEFEADYDAAHEQAVTHDIITEARAADWEDHTSSTDSPEQLRKVPRCSLFSFLALFLTAEVIFTERGRRVR